MAERTVNTDFPPVSIVVPALNEAKLLPRCLGSLQCQDYPGLYDIIVVDNASTDATAAVATCHGARVVHEARRSPAWARQRGLAVAKGEIVAFLDADSKAPRNWLRMLVGKLLRDPTLVAVSGPCYYYDVTVPLRLTSRVVLFTTMVVDHLIRWAFRKGGALWGCNFAARRTCLLTAGGFNTHFPFLGEDAELATRLARTGKIGLLPLLFVGTSARRLRHEGLIHSYWNYITSYFCVVFAENPVPPTSELGLRRMLSRVHEGVLLRLMGAVGISSLSQQTNEGCEVALTFDDGPNESATPTVLDILRSHDVRATFFLVGHNARASPELCQRIVREGHKIGNHSHRHTWWSSISSPWSVKGELARAQREIETACGLGFFVPHMGCARPG